jgi:hypothetical protein
MYYWRVLPLDPAKPGHAGYPSEERSFTAGYNFVPTLLAPADNAQPVFTPTFRWTAVRGAQSYILQYTTDPNLLNTLTTVTTKNTSYTPVATIPNDVNYYWHVKAISGNSDSGYSDSRTFIKKWYIQPQLLTPQDNYRHQRNPLFSWTPVPGASTYRIDIDISIGFSSTKKETGTTSNTFYSPEKYDGSDLIYYWRVTPIDGSGKDGKVSETHAYRSYGDSLGVDLAYPMYYYPPTVFKGPSGTYTGIATNPHEDRTVPYPVFIWHRLLQPAFSVNQGEVYAEAYRLQVATDPNFDNIVWAVDTENTSATPSAAHPFTPTANIDYYWRVCALVSGSCPTNNDNGTLVDVWSQVWLAHFDPLSDPKLVNPPPSPTLIRPTNGYEFGESTPLLEWFPISGASSYDVQISQDLAFPNTAETQTATVAIPAYAPTQALAQRSLGDTDFGVYYWRVRKTGSATWSATGRFQIAAQSQWQYSRTAGSSNNQLRIGSDPADTTNADYELTSLYAAQDSANWYFGFDVPASTTTNVTYALYLDTNHLDGSGAATDARGYTMSAIPAYRPEYAIYVFQTSGSFANNVLLYHWNGSSWDAYQILQNIGGALNQTGTTVELKIPNTAIGYPDNAGFTAALLSLPASSGQPVDSVPSMSNLPSINRFANVTERMNLVAPLNNAGIDPTTLPTVLPFLWDWPIRAPYSGAYMKAYLDSQFTTEKATYTLTSDTPYYARLAHAWDSDFSGDNTYYWRMQPRYQDGSCTKSSPCAGAWTQGWRFDRKGFVPQNLQTSVTLATPTFSWDMVEGVESYSLFVTNTTFGTTPLVTTTQTSYTDDSTFANGIYHWKVCANRDKKLKNDCSVVKDFTLSLPVPTGLGSTPASVDGPAPTLYWTPVIANDSHGDPVFAAYKYRIQVDNESSLTAPFYDTIDTEQSSWTPDSGYADGTYYWHVAVIDGAGKVGNYSATQQFTKQYPITTLVSPLNGASQNTTPTFVWTPVDGAASYKLEISKYSAFSPTYVSTTTNNTRYTPINTFDLGVKYYWRVAIIDANNKTGPYTNATIFLNTLTKTFTSISTQDGWVLESGETTNQGKTLSNKGYLMLGDDTGKKQYRAILSFNTSSLPDTAVIKKITLRFKRQSVKGAGDPMTIFGGFMVDVRKGPFGKTTLEALDFQSTASKTYGPFKPALVGGWYSIDLTPASTYINKLTTNSSLTQFRLRFKIDDNGNSIANYITLYGGDAGAAYRPLLVIQYTP